MAKKITYKSTFEEIGWSLRETLDEIEQHGETIQLKFEMLLKYGRVLFMEGKFNKAYHIFQQCSIHGIDNGITELKELYYWTSRCLEEKGNSERALNGYLTLLENKGFIENDEEYLDAILDRLILFGDITQVVNKYKKDREEELNNPKELIGKIIKLLKEGKE